MNATTTGRGPLARWWDGRTLLWRLVAGLLALLLVTCAVVGIATTLALRGFLVDRLDRQLTQDRGLVIGPIAAVLDRAAPLPGREGGPFGGSPGGDDGPSRGGRDGDDGDDEDDDGGGGPGGAGLEGALGARLVGGEVARATVLRRGSPLGTVPTDPALDAADRAALAALPVSGPVSALTLGAGAYRAIALPSRGGVLVVALPTDGVRATTGRLVTIELVVFAVAIALAGLAGAAAVRIALRPLRRVAATAGAVAATPMASGAVVMPAGVAEVDERTEVGQVGAAFNRMLGQVGGALAQRQATEERLRRFVADASHELRTPLAVIRGHSELAGRRAAELPQEVAHALDRVNAESLRMGVLVDDLLLLARLDAGRPLAREEVDLTRLVLDATSDARASDGVPDGAARPAHRWRLELPEEPVTVVGDAHRLHQVLANLLSNARTHTPPGTTVTVVLEREGASVGLRVVDDGPGVPQEVAGHVFERFVRADASRTRAGAGGEEGDAGSPGGSDGSGSSGSSGLGLAIVDAVVAAHGGTVRLESRPGSTTFRVVLPLALPTPA